MENPEENDHHHGHSDADLVAGHVEITLHVQEDSVAGGGEEEVQKLPAKGLEKKASFGSSLARNASSRIKQVSQDLKRLASLTRHPQPPKRFDRTKTAAAQALKGLKFISKTEGGSAWAGVEERFDKLASATDGLLPRSLFGECIGKIENKSLNYQCYLILCILILCMNHDHD